MPAAAVLASLVMVDWALEGPGRQRRRLGRSGQRLRRFRSVWSPTGCIWPWVPPLPALFGFAGFDRQGHSVRPIAPLLWAGSAVFAPVAILVALYYRLAGFERSIPFALAALALVRPVRRGDRPADEAAAGSGQRIGLGRLRHRVRSPLLR